MGLHVSKQLYVMLASFILVCGCGVRAPQLGTLSQEQRCWADQLILGFSPLRDATIPADIRSSEAIVRYIEAAYPKCRILEQYQYKGFLFLPLRLSRHQKRGRDENFLNLVVVDLTSGEYEFVLVAKS